VVCDLQSELIPEDAFDGVDTVFHLAGFADDLGDASKVEELYRAVNVDATVCLAELAVGAGVRRFAFVSSVKATTSDGVYGQTKRKAELKLLEMGQVGNACFDCAAFSGLWGGGKGDPCPDA
jgi:nucleoside-diphosphate-sugar epimerase